MSTASLIGRMILLTLSIATASAVIAQSPGKIRNNPYSPSPSAAYTSSVGARASSDKPALTRQVAFVTTNDAPTPGETTTFPTTVGSAASIYRLGAGDVLFIDVKNTSSGSYYTVRQDGTIDLQVGGIPVRAGGQTVEELRAHLTKASKTPAEVRIREYNSHKITVVGQVDRPGPLTIQRDAMPIFAIRATVGVKPGVETVSITRSNTSVAEVYALNAAGTENVLVMPGDRVEFHAKGRK